MTDLYIIKVGEICLKGGNRNFFEKKLRNNIKRKLKEYSPKLTNVKGRFFLRIENVSHEIVSHALSTTFGIVAFAKSVTCKKDIESIKEVVKKLIIDEKSEWKTFKAETRRADKSFPMSSYEISCDIGGIVLDMTDNKKVTMKNPDLVINIEIRDKTYIYIGSEKGPGGLPVGSAGKGILMLSGGIDSPVAGYLMAKRGLKQNAVYFHTYPYTSDDAKNKVIELAKTLAVHLNGLRLYIVPFTDVQLKINDSCNKEETTIHMRCAMVKIADLITKDEHGIAVVTGEALSQVASQTAESIRVTDNATDLPVFRPVIGFDKEEIIKIARKIDTYETSILPYEDCCTLFSPEHPLTRPDFQELTNKFEGLELVQLMHKAVEDVEVVSISVQGIISTP